MALKISKSRITVGSDGLLLVDLTDAAGAGISPADYKFRIELYGSREASLRGCATEISDADKYVISYDGTERKNCKLVDGRLYILVKRYSLKSGVVYYSQYESFEDLEFEDQEYRQVAYGTLDLTITTDGSSTADQTAFVTISSAALKGEALTYEDLTDEQKEELKGSIIIDPTPTENSDNAVSSGGVYEALQNIDAETVTVSGDITSGSRVVAEGDIKTNDGNVFTSDGNVYTSDGDIYTTEGDIYTVDGDFVAREGSYYKGRGDDKVEVAYKEELPTKTSDLTNDSEYIANTVNDLANYYLKSETFTQAEVTARLNAITTINFETVTELPTEGASNLIYLLPNGDVYDEYIWVNNAWEVIGSTQVDLTNYYTKTQTDSTFVQTTADMTIGGQKTFALSPIVPTAVYDNEAPNKGYVDTQLATKVNVVSGKDLSSNDYTDTEKTKLAGIEDGAEVNPTTLPNPYSLTINNTVYDGSEAKSITISSEGGSGASTWDEISGKPDFAAVATSGDYEDLSNTPIIPSIEGLATKDYVTEAIADIEGGDGKSAYDLYLEETSDDPVLTLEEFTMAQSSTAALLAQQQQGKNTIAEAITLKSITTSGEETYEEMAEKIGNINTKEVITLDSEDFYAEMFAARLGDGKSRYNIIEEYEAYRRDDYDTHIIVELIRSQTTAILTGADAYYVSDGTFYTSDATHVWETYHPVYNRYIIYYYLPTNTNKRLESLTTTNVSSTVVNIYCYNTVAPKAIRTSNTVSDAIYLHFSDDAPRVELYLAANYFIYSNVAYTDNSSYSNQYSVSNYNVYLPNLVEVDGNTGAAYQIFITGALTMVPSLTTISGGYRVFYGGNRTFLDLSSLETISGGNYVVASIGNLASIDMSSLSEISGGSYIVQGCSILTSLEFPSLETISGGSYIVNSNSRLASLKLPNLTTITSGNNIIDTNASLTTLECPSLISLTLSGSIFLGTLASLTSISMPLLETIVNTSTSSNQYFFYNIASESTPISVLEFPSLKTLSGGSSSQTLCYNAYVDTLKLPALESVTNMRINYSTFGKIRRVELGNSCTTTFYLSGGTDTYMEEFFVAEGFTNSLWFSYNTALTHDSLVLLLTNAGDLTETTSQTITMGATNLAKLTDEEKEIATNKNWTLA